MYKQGWNNWWKAAIGVILFATTVCLPAQAEIIGLSGTSFNFSTRTDHISTGEGNSVMIWGYTAGERAQYPGPTLIVNQNDVVTINLTNNLPVATSIVFPGHQVTASGGSMGLLTQEAAPGQTVSYTFTATQPGTYQYHSGTNPALQVEMGLVGALIVRPAGFDPASAATRTAYGDASSAYDYEVLFLQTEMDPTFHDLIEFGRMNEVDTSAFHPVYWFLNGRNGPDTLLGNNVAWLPTQPYNCLPRIRPGEKLLLRVIGGGRDPHPFHTHGNNSLIIARDGRLLSSGPGNGADLSVSDYTISTWPGATYDAVFTWTGEQMGWDMYGSSQDTTPNIHNCIDNVNNETGLAPPDGFADANSDYPWEWCADHDKVMPVTLPGINELTFSPFYSGSPYLGGGAFLPPGEGGFNQNGGYYYMWHSHSEKELTNFDIFPGGMLTFLIIEPPSVNDIQ